mgnify:CR=1 FL=1
MQLLGDAALQLAELGFLIFPLQPGRKLPLPGSHGCLDATSDEDKIDTWWTANPQANIGLACDGLVVIDVEAESAWLTDEQRMRDLLATGCPQQVTANGGRHFFFRQPDGGAEIRNSVGKLAPKVDVRATGGYVVVGPSVLAGDRRYLWVEGCELPPVDQLPEAPEWIVGALVDRVAPSERLAVEVDGGPIPSGVRNDVLARLAGTMRRVGLGKAAIEAALQQVNAERCQPPLVSDEVAKIAWSVSRYSPDIIAQAGAECWWEQLTETDEHGTKESSPGDLPGKWLRPPGLISDIVDFNLATALYPQPAMALAGALCLMGAITGRKIMDCRGARTNLQVLVLAPSGAGKDHARFVNKQLLTAAAAVDLVGPDRISSHAGIISTLAAHPVTLFQPDEFHGLVASVTNGRNSPWLRQIPEVIKEVYSAARTLWKPTSYGDAKANISIDQPHAVLHCTGVSEWFWDAVGRELITSGFVGRMLLFDLRCKPTTPTWNRAANPLDKLVDNIKWWTELHVGGDLATEHPQPMVVEADDDAAQRLYDHMVAVRMKQIDDSPVSAAIWSRSAEKTGQLALIVAASRQTGCKGQMRISIYDVNYAIAINNWSTRWLVWCATTRSADGDHQRRTQRILSAVPGKWITGKELCKRTHHMLEQGSRKRIVDDLVEAGKLERRVTAGKTKPTTEYRNLAAD